MVTVSMILKVHNLNKFQAVTDDEMSVFELSLLKNSCLLMRLD